MDVVTGGEWMWLMWVCLRRCMQSLFRCFLGPCLLLPTLWHHLPQLKQQHTGVVQSLCRGCQQPAVHHGTCTYTFPSCL